MKAILLLSAFGVAIPFLPQEGQPPQRDRTQQQEPQRTQPSVPLEAHLIILDQGGQAIDISAVQGTLFVTPEAGQEQGIRLEPVPAKGMKGAVPGRGMPAEPKEPSSQDPMAQPQKAGKPSLFLGQVKKLDNYVVKFVVLHGPLVQAATSLTEPRSAVRPAAQGAQDSGKAQAWGDFPIHVKGPYLKADLSRVVTPGQPVKFMARAEIMMEDKTHQIEDLSYPDAYYQESTSRMSSALDNVTTMIQQNQWNQVEMLGRQIHKSVLALPPLEIEGDPVRFQTAQQEVTRLSEELAGVAKQQNRERVQDLIDQLKSRIDEFGKLGGEAAGVSLQKIQQRIK